MTLAASSAFAVICYFNSHAHVERDSQGYRSAYPLCYFNSHAHVERDPFVRTKLHSRTISTHTLTWSVTLEATVYYERNEYFNSHAHVERDRILNLQKIHNPISTHTLTWSVTDKPAEDKQEQPFQLTRSRGA